MRDPIEATEDELRLLGNASIAVSILGFVGVVAGNVTHSWWPIIVGGPLMLAVVAYVAVRLGRNRDRSMWDVLLTGSSQGWRSRKWFRRR